MDSNENHYSGFPLYGSGTIMSARAFDAILCQTTYTPEVLDFLGCCLSITASDHIASGEESHQDYSAILVQLNVAKEFWNKPYANLYTTMLTEYGMIVIVCIAVIGTLDCVCVHRTITVRQQYRQNVCDHKLPL